MLPELSEKEARERIAKRIAAELKDGDTVNLGIGVPQLVADYVPANVQLILQTENGALLACPAKDAKDLRVIDAGGHPISVLPGGCFVSADLSFAIMRGGHIDVTVLGTLQVDRQGNLANWMVPGQRVPGMGGAMDIVAGAKKVFAATRLFDKSGACKFVEKCTLPLTGRSCVDVIVTEYCLFKRINGQMALTETAEGVTASALESAIGMRFETKPQLN